MPRRSALNKTNRKDSWAVFAFTSTTGELPVVEFGTPYSTNAPPNALRPRIRGYRWTVGATAAASTVVGQVLLYAGNTTVTAALSTYVIGHAGPAGPMNCDVDLGECYIEAPYFRATFGAGSSAMRPLSVSLWGDWA